MKKRIMSLFSVAAIIAAVTGCSFFGGSGPDLSKAADSLGADKCDDLDDYSSREEDLESVFDGNGKAVSFYYTAEGDGIDELIDTGKMMAGKNDKPEKVTFYMSVYPFFNGDEDDEASGGGYLFANEYKYKDEKDAKDLYEATLDFIVMYDGDHGLENENSGEKDGLSFKCIEVSWCNDDDDKAGSYEGGYSFMGVYLKDDTVVFIMEDMEDIPDDDLPMLGNKLCDEMGIPKPSDKGK